MNEFDYVVAGGGSAGCAVAARLAEDPALRVCLVEAGGNGRSLLIDTPAMLSVTVPRKLHNWAFQTEPQPGLASRRGYQPRGKALGGSSAINAMVYMRGHPRDYDEWNCPGWTWRDVLPVFLRGEHNERGADDFHATGGPLNVADARSPNVTSLAFVEAGVQAGHARNADFNGTSQMGVGLYQVTQKHGRRWSAARAYVDAAVARGNLSVLTDTHALRLLFSGKACVGVETTRGSLRAKRETIVCGGAFGSPQMLLLSGIGPREALAPHGIALRHELPGVGAQPAGPSRLRDRLPVRRAGPARPHGARHRQPRRRHRRLPPRRPRPTRLQPRRGRRLPRALARCIASRPATALRHRPGRGPRPRQDAALRLFLPRLRAARAKPRQRHPALG
jgi:choline dehydrogenase-like flavoprotein